MVHIPEYSLVIRPPQEIIDLIAGYKKRLYAEIGWFGSMNSQAHITVFNFDATADELPIRHAIIEDFCKTITPQKVVFDHFDAFPPRTFFIAPDEPSMDYLNGIITAYARFVKERPRAHAHLSVARSLKEGQLDRARDLFTEPVNLEFLCDGLTLRRFDPNLKQYADIVGWIAFGRDMS